MSDEEIFKLWRLGLNKDIVAKIYMKSYNQRVKIIRLDIRNRKVKFLTYYEALNKVEKIILKNIKKY
ncbi:MAG TPA: hypothetical protein IAD08_03945 [Candidatus Scatovivens faecipullorum]|nr:hypothetical protein [Candidatus Scatovivens faecipullorum]